MYELTQYDVEELEDRYSYPMPKQGQPERYEAIRTECLSLAFLISELIPRSRERATALTRLDEVMFHANAAIARNE